MDQGDKKSYARTVRIFSFLHSTFLIGLLSVLDGYPKKTLNEILAKSSFSCTEIVTKDFSKIQSSLFMWKMSQLVLTVICLSRNFLFIFWITKKVKRATTATSIILIKQKWVDGCFARLFKILQILLQISIVFYAVYNIFSRSGINLTCATDDLREVDSNLNNNLVFVLLGNLFSCYFPLFGWLLTALFWSRAQEQSGAEEKRGQLDIEESDSAAPKQKPNEKKKKNDSDYTAFGGGEEEDLHRPLILDDAPAISFGVKKQLPKRTNHGDETEKNDAPEKSSDLYQTCTPTYEPNDAEQAFQASQPYQAYQPYQPEKTDQIYQPYKPYQPY